MSSSRLILSSPSAVLRNRVITSQFCFAFRRRKLSRTMGVTYEYV